LLLKTHEACEILGGIHARTLARLEQRGLIRGVKLLRHKLYARADIEALVEEVRKWNR
jgi:DNA-binding transcriptional MerR regulator